MSKFAALAGGQAGTIVAGAVVVAVVIGGSAYLMRDADKSDPQAALVTETAMVPEAQTPEARAPQAVPEPAPAKTQNQTASETPDTVPAGEAVATEAAPHSVPDAPAAQPPSFDEVRTENDGLTVIAGKAAPGSQVIVLVDGAEAARVTAEANGTFAAIAMLDPGPKARLLTLSQTDGDTSLASVDQIILAPVTKAPPKPEVKPDAKPEAGSVVVAAVPAQTSTPSPEPEPEPEPEQQAFSAQEPTPAPVATPAPQVDVADASAASVSGSVSEPAPDQQPQTDVADRDVRTPAPEQDEPVQAATAATPQASAEPEPASTDVAPVPAPAEVAVLKADADGIEVISRSSAPEVMSSVAIDTISYSAAGDVQLSGRAQADARVIRVYLNNAPVITLDVDTSGRWRGNLPDVDTGVYTLRVDEVNAGGEVTSRVETPFKREDPAVLAEAQSDATQPISAITVQTGATLWAIARDRYGDGLLYVRVFEANKDAIKDPDLIYPGQIFELPEDQ